MSAYIVQPEHLGILAAYIANPTDTGFNLAVGQWDASDSTASRSNNTILTAQNVARGLARENIRSVAAYYPDDEDGERPGPAGLKDAEIIEAAALWAAHYVAAAGTARRLTPVQLLKLCNGLAYQCDSVDYWKSTVACQQLERLTNHVIGLLPGYWDAPWEHEDANAQLDALIYGEVA